MANKKVSQLTSKPSVLVTDLFPIADPSTGQLYKTTISDLGTAIGSGVSSVNGLVGAVVLDTDDIQELVSPTNKWFTDTRARAALSASSPLAYNSGTGVFSIPAATSSQNGYLTSTDWTTFNNKLSTATAASTYVPYTGATADVNLGTKYLSCNGINFPYATLSNTVTGPTGFGNSSVLFSLTGYGNLFGVDGAFSTKYFGIKTDGTFVHVGGNASFGGNISSVNGTFTGDLTISSTNPRIYLTDSDNNPDYFISNTDGTFTVYDVTNSTARFTIGTTGNATFANAITGGGSISGTALYSTGIISAGTSLSVGTFVSAGGSLTGSALYVTGMTAGSGAIYHTGSRLTFANYNASGTLHFEVNGGTGALTLNADTSASFVAGASFGGALSGTSASFSGNAFLSSTNTSGGVGIGTSSIVTSYPGSNILQIGTRGFIQNVVGNQMMISNNAYLNPDGWKYGTTANAQAIRFGAQSAGDISFHIAPSGTAGNAISNWDTSDIKMYIAPSGNVGINTTSPSSKLHVNGGLRLQNGSSDLTYYEEGTFTPSLTFGGGSTGMTFFDRAGVYTRIGRQVTCTIYLALTAKGSSTGDASLTGLPFTNGNYNRGSSSAASIRFDNITYSGDLQMILPASTNYISFEQVTTAGVDSRLSHSNFNDSTEMTITVSYFV